MKNLKTTAIVLASLLISDLSLAAPISINTTTSGSWLSFTPGPDQSGSSISSSGTTFESANVGWNTSVSYNDSGWTPFSGSWGNSAPSPIYLRKEFTLGTPTFGQISGGVDDDLMLWVNGNLVINDQNGFSTSFAAINILPYLISGNNLIAIKAHDSFGGQQSFSILGSVDATDAVTVPEPETLALMGLGILGIRFSGIRRSKRSC
jgi:hypothetical protein